MADTIKIPGAGPVSKKTAAVAGVLAVVVIGIAVYRHKKASTAASGTPTAGDPYPPDGTTGNPADPYSTDPATGVTYGDEQAAGAAGQAFQSGGQAPGNPPFPAPAPGSTTPTFTDNASWAQYAESYLEGLGDRAGVVAEALGKYITGHPVTPAQQGLIEQAIAFAGKPPVSGPGGFPPSINLLPAGGGGGTKKVPRHTVTANGHQDLQQIAAANGVTDAVLVQANLGLKWRYDGHILPRGTRVTIPAHTEKG